MCEPQRNTPLGRWIRRSSLLRVQSRPVVPSWRSVLGDEKTAHMLLSATRYTLLVLDPLPWQNPWRAVPDRVDVIRTISPNHWSNNPSPTPSAPAQSCFFLTALPCTSAWNSRARIGGCSTEARQRLTMHSLAFLSRKEGVSLPKESLSKSSGHALPRQFGAGANSTHWQRTHFLAVRVGMTNAMTHCTVHMV